MSKRRKDADDVEEETAFKLPKFDEEAFLKRERRNIKTTIISFFFGCLMAFVCFGFWALMGRSVSIRWELVLLVAVANAIFLKYIFLRLKIDLTDFGRRNWFGAYITYFFTWLVVFIVIVNPPFFDDENPRISAVVLPNMQEPGGTVKIVAKITDNIGIEKSNIQFLLTDPNGVTTSPDFTFKNNIFNFTFESPSNLISDQDTYNFKISATDSGGLKTEYTGSFSYSNNTIHLADPSNGSSVRAASDIKFGVAATINRVYYVVDGGIEINATKIGDWYVTNPVNIGWPKNKNVTVNVSAYVVYYFENIADDFNNTIVDTDTYTFTVQDDPTVGTKVSPEVTLPKARFVIAPGFEILVFLISLIAVVLILKYRKKNKQQK